MSCTQKTLSQTVTQSTDFSGAKIAIFLGSNLLVIRRDDKPDIPYPGHWDLMGGGREGDEAPIDCALRETKEEVGLDIAAQDVSWSRTYMRPRGRVWLFATHQPAHLVQKVVFGDEGQEWQLMDPQIYCDHRLAVPHFATNLADYMRSNAYKRHKAA